MSVSFLFFCSFNSSISRAHAFRFNVHDMFVHFFRQKNRIKYIKTSHFGVHIKSTFIVSFVELSTMSNVNVHGVTCVFYCLFILLPNWKMFIQFEKFGHFVISQFFHNFTMISSFLAMSVDYVCTWIIMCNENWHINA